MSRLPRQLDAIEIRVLGCLLEKQQATPEYYPLTMNALLSACNQRSNRNPVLNLFERDIGRALMRLVDDRLVTRDDRGRAARWRQNVDRLWNLDPGRKAVLTVLLLRGPQTAGEVRARTARMYEFPSAEAAEGALADLAGPPDPLVELLERDPGQKEPRWGHRVGSDEAVASAPAPAGQSRVAAAPSPGPGIDLEKLMMRIERLEQQVQELQSKLTDRPGLFD